MDFLELVSDEGLANILDRLLVKHGLTLDLATKVAIRSAVRRLRKSGG